MLLSCPDRGEKPGLRAQPVCWGRWQAPDPHDVAWRILFAALRISVEYMVEHIFLYGDDVGCDNFRSWRQCLRRCACIRSGATSCIACTIHRWRDVMARDIPGVGHSGMAREVRRA